MSYRLPLFKTLSGMTNIITAIMSKLFFMPRIISFHVLSHTKKNEKNVVKSCVSFFQCDDGCFFWAGSLAQKTTNSYKTSNIKLLGLHLYLLSKFICLNILLSSIWVFIPPDSLLTRIYIDILPACLPLLLPSPRYSSSSTTAIR